MKDEAIRQWTTGRSWETYYAIISHDFRAYSSNPTAVEMSSLWRRRCQVSWTLSHVYRSEYRRELVKHHHVPVKDHVLETPNIGFGNREE